MSINLHTITCCNKLFFTVLDADVVIVDKSNRPEKMRQKRTNFTTEQLELLEKEFTEKKYLNFLERCQLASELKLSEQQVSIIYNRYGRCS